MDFYKQYFDASYDEHKTSITEAIRRTEEQLSDKVLGALREQSKANELVLAQWARYVSSGRFPNLM